jgi:hypothetical protein
MRMRYGMESVCVCVCVHVDKTRRKMVQ